MSIRPGRPYRIMNQMAGLALEVSDHAPFIVGEYIEPIDTQTWFVEPADFEGGVYIKSKANGKYIGIQLTPIRGVPVILVEREFAKVWVIETRRPANYQIKLRATDLVMEFAKENLHPGTEAKLAFESPEEINKVWVITERES
ncbi:hypothetical protein EI94DRAFT_1814491 [Lactarius quietus]|nr:hypothetical protein EI94DRAFT_1814491 [Lactarius quietus]